ncbi:MAG: hypothetical protein L0387_46085 [Acidobacteria bacterium]|nr:hypothetical protein [Acidobacteriota bacterium]MCI0724026.1 hypothetical protein [Acidobacteriota bacterium]
MSSIFPLTLALSPNTKNVLGEREQMVGMLTQGTASGDGGPEPQRRDLKVRHRAESIDASLSGRLRLGIGSKKRPSTSTTGLRQRLAERSDSDFDRARHPGLHLYSLVKIVVRPNRFGFALRSDQEAIWALPGKADGERAT